MLLPPRRKKRYQMMGSTATVPAAMPAMVPVSSETAESVLLRSVEGGAGVVVACAVDVCA